MQLGASDFIRRYQEQKPMLKRTLYKKTAYNTDYQNAEKAIFRKSRLLA